MTLDDQEQSFLSGIFTVWAIRRTLTSISTIKGGKKGPKIMMALVVHVEDCVWMTLRRKMALNG
jgi:hypothetical protein